MTISIKIVSNSKYEVIVKSNTVTTHTVSLSDEVHKNLTNNKVTKKNFGTLVLSSFWIENPTLQFCHLLN